MKKPPLASSRSRPAYDVLKKSEERGWRSAETDDADPFLAIAHAPLMPLGQAQDIVSGLFRGRRAMNKAYRAGVIVAALTAFFTVWEYRSR